MLVDVEKPSITTPSPLPGYVDGGFECRLLHKTFWASRPMIPHYHPPHNPPFNYFYRACAATLDGTEDCGAEATMRFRSVPCTGYAPRILRRSALWHTIDSAVLHKHRSFSDPASRCVPDKIRWFPTRSNRRSILDNKGWIK